MQGERLLEQGKLIRRWAPPDRFYRVVAPLQHSLRVSAVQASREGLAEGFAQSAQRVNPTRGGWALIAGVDVKHRFVLPPLFAPRKIPPVP